MYVYVFFFFISLQLCYWDLCSVINLFSCLQTKSSVCEPFDGHVWTNPENLTTDAFWKVFIGKYLMELQIDAYSSPPNYMFTIGRRCCCIKTAPWNIRYEMPVENASVRLAPLKIVRSMWNFLFSSLPYDFPHTSKYIQTHRSASCERWRQAYLTLKRIQYSLFKMLYQRFDSHFIWDS